MMTKNDIKYLKSLQQKKYRDLHSSFVIEGEKIIAEMFKSGNRYNRLFITEDAPESFKENDVFHIKKAEMSRISGLKSPSNCLAELPFFDESELPFPESETFIGLDDIQDPGNLGTIIRICDWFAIPNIICSRDCVDQYNPKVVQASMGGIFRVNVYYTDLEKYCKELIDRGLGVLATSMDGIDVATAEKPSSGLLVIGNEGRGISDQIKSLAEQTLSIKRIGEAESLNASIACGILVNWLKS